MCGRKLFSNNKRLHKRLRVFSFDCLGDRCRLCYLWRMQGACRRAQTNWLVCFDRVIAISSYPWSFEVFTFLWAFFRASTVLLVQCTSNFNQKLKFTEVYVSFQKVFFFVFFFDMNHNRRAILYIYKTDYTMSLTLFTLTSVCIFSKLFSIHFHFI